MRLGGERSRGSRNPNPTFWREEAAEEHRGGREREIDERRGVVVTYWVGSLSHT